MRAETEIKYFYPSLMSYISLRKALKNGITTKELKTIKDFKCDCSQHKNLSIQALVDKEKDTLIFEECEFTAKSEGVDAIDSKGKILLEGYKFYSIHPDWKVRVAVTIGLSKLIDEAAVVTLSSMLTDKHWSVKLAAVQALGVINVESAKNILEEMDDKNSKGRLGELANRAVKRHKFGINIDKINKYTLYKLLSSNQSRKIHHHISKTNKILVSKQMFHGFLDKIPLQKFLNHSNDTAYTADKTFNLVKFNQQNIPIRSQRFTKEDRKKDKINYANQLFYKQVLPIENFENISNSISGEIYWAIVESSDPKITRPLLIVRAVEQKAGYFLVMPLTSDISSKSDGMLVDINGKKSKVQISRQRIVEKSVLLNKYGSISESDLQKIQDPINAQQKNINSRHAFYKSKKSNKPSGRFSEKYIVDDVPITRPAESKISIIANPNIRNPKILIKPAKAKKAKKSKKTLKNLTELSQIKDSSTAIEKSDKNYEKGGKQKPKNTPISSPLKDSLAATEKPDSDHSKKDKKKLKNSPKPSQLKGSSATAEKPDNSYAKKSKQKPKNSFKFFKPKGSSVTAEKLEKDDGKRSSFYFKK